jgi:hypothetical protein
MQPVDDKIMALFSVFDDPRSSFFNCYYRGDVSSWQPTTLPEKEALAQLAHISNRAALKQWYSEVAAINPVAEVMRRFLEKYIGDELPLKRE